MERSEGRPDTGTVTGWWACADCGADAELPGLDVGGVQVRCPDCDGVMAQLWSWDVAGVPRAA